MALGVQAARVNAAVGPDVLGLGVGDTVLCHPILVPDDGTWAPLLIAPADSPAHKPPTMAWDVATIFPVPALTTEGVISEVLDLRSGETLPVHGRTVSTVV
jgi:NADPH:quinone reductase-like Zn-dependent oxidoreductase